MGMMRCLFALLTWVAVAKGQCSISMAKDMPKIEPLILSPSPGTGFLYPNKEGILELSKNAKVRIVCNGRGNHFVNLGDQVTKISDTIAECESKTKLKVSGRSIDAKNLGCKSWPSTEQRVTGTCTGSYMNYEIGFELANEFVKLIQLCHDPIQVSTLYTQFKMVKEISGARKSSPRPQFAECPEHTACYNPQYNRDSQINALSVILGSLDEAKKYIKKDTVSYLARGHLVANADFVYNSQKRATYYYINQEPQWQRCNAYSWFPLENAIRKYASSTDQDLIVYTGVHQIAQLQDKNNVWQDLYLSVSANNIREIPVPRFFWKVIYNERTQHGIAFVEINNQYLKVLPANYKICGKVLQKTIWDIDSRDCLWYNCEVDELRKHVVLPSFKVTGILA